MRSFGAEAFLALVLASTAALGEDGELDPSFGTGGLVVTDVDPAGMFERPSGGRSVAVQPDGSILVGGADRTNFVVFRHLADGSLDPSFGTGGKVSTDFSGSDANELEDLALQGAGRVVAAGSTYAGPGDLRVALARYDPDGTPDATFGAAGLVTTSLGVSAEGQALALQPDGTMMVVAVTHGSTADFALARYAADGSLDPTFDGDGVLLLDLDADPSVGGVPTNLAVQPDGKLLVTGWFSEIETGFLARLGADGSLDPSFGTAGVQLLADLAPSAVAVQADGRLVLAGSLQGGDGPIRPALLRLLDGGALDGSFGDAGRYDGGAVGGGVFEDLLVEPGGRIVAGGRRSGPDFLLARFESDGALDASFGRCAVTVTAVDAAGHALDGALAVARQADGKLVAAGGSDGHFAVARYGAPPLPACAAAESQRGKLVFRAPRTTLVWQWQGAPVVSVDIGDPLATTGYRFCVVDAANRPLVQATVPPATILPESWSALEAGFRFGRPITVVPDGVTKVLLKALPTTAGKLKLRMHTVPSNLVLGLESGPLVPPVTARLLRTDGDGCFETVFSAPSKNVESGFRARSD